MRKGKKILKKSKNDLSRNCPNRMKCDVLTGCPKVVDTDKGKREKTRYDLLDMNR